MKKKCCPVSTNNMNTEQCIAELFMMSVVWNCVLYISAGPNNTILNTVTDLFMEQHTKQTLLFTNNLAASNQWLGHQKVIRKHKYLCSHLNATEAFLLTSIMDRYPLFMMYVITYPSRVNPGLNGNISFVEYSSLSAIEVASCNNFVTVTMFSVLVYGDENFQYIEAETKWVPCCRRHFQFHLLIFQPHRLGHGQRLNLKWILYKKCCILINIYWDVFTNGKLTIQRRSLR